MHHKLRPWLGAVVSAVALTVSPLSIADDDNRFNNPNTITLIQLADTHGNLVPHRSIIHRPDGTEYVAEAAGGVAKLKTAVDQIRAENPNNLLIAVGDSTHGTAETMFTVGDAIMPALNAFGIDAYVPGNWEFGYGPAVFRARFTPANPALPLNIRVMANKYDGPGVTKATFPTLAANLYNVSPPLPPFAHNKRVLPAYKLFTVGNSTVAVIGITASIVPQQPDVFNIGLRFTQGVEELPGLIDEVEAAGADIIVVASELGLSQNIEIGRRFEDVDVVLSAHTHEVTHGALLADEDGVIATTPGASLSGEEQERLADGAAIVVETGEELYLGRLDLQVAGDRVIGFNWEAIPMDDSVAEDPAMKALADHAEEPFIAGADGIVERHTFMPGGYCAPPPTLCGDVTKRGLQLTEDLDTVVGHTDTLLARHNVLEDVVNNFMADAFRAGANEVTTADISMTNGFRFGNPVLPGPITLRDLYTLFPISPAFGVAEFSGASIESSLELILDTVFNRNPFLQRGGWYIGLSNMTQKIDLDNAPFSSSGKRIVETKIGGVPLDPSKRYRFASCYPHGNAIDRICRTPGGSNHMFFELADADDYSSAMSLQPPKNTANITLVRPVGSTPPVIIRQVAPDRFVHPVHLLRRYLDSLPGKTVSGADYAVGRVQTVDSTRFGNPAVPAPVSEPDPTLIQPPQGAGPKFFSGRVGDDD